MTQNHNGFYSKAKYYDVAFNFKNVKEENQTILNVYQRIQGISAKSFLDIAAGPATNAIEMAQRGLKTAALDFSPEMVAYGLDKAKSTGVELKYLQGDMRIFEMSEPVDLAAIFMDSTSYLLTTSRLVIRKIF